MGIRPGGERGCPGGRGQSSVIGVVLILGLVITSMTVIATVGGLALLNTEDELSVARAEKVMTQFDSQSALVALGETNARQTQLAAGNDGEYTLDEDAGWMRISIRNTSANATGSPTKIVNSSLGAMVYETDGVRIAYQGGGVWKKGSGEAVMVSPPEFHYRGQTLTLPIVNLTGEDQVSGQVTVRQGGISQEYPNETFVNPVPAEREVVVTVKSEYYRGWGTYFERRTDGNVSYDNANQTAAITLTVPLEENFDNAVATTEQNGISRTGNSQIDGPTQTGVNNPSASGRIEARIDTYDDGACGSLSNCTKLVDGNASTIDSGVKYADGNLSFGSSTVFDTSSGDIDIVVNGSVTFDSGTGSPGTEDHAIQGDGTVTIYAKGDLNINGNAGVNTDGEPSDLLTLLHSDADVAAASGTPQYTGAIYAPNSKFRINGGGACGATGGPPPWAGPSSSSSDGCDGNIVGPVVVEEAKLKGNAKIKYDGNIDFSVKFTQPAAITYLHVSETKITVSDG